MVQIFVTFGLAILVRGCCPVRLGRRLQRRSAPGFPTAPSISAASICPCRNSPPAWSASPPSACCVAISGTEFGKALEATREDRDAVALIGIDA
jgi:branched-chain amino acid transport system permease protein